MTDSHLHASDYEVRPVSLKAAQALVAAHHYARSGSNTAVYTHGLFRRGEDTPLGVAWWMPPTKGAAVATFPEGDWRRVLALTRLVLVPGLPTNAATYMLARSVRLIRQDGRFDCLVTYADESQGHTGTIYKASNWSYMGRTKPQPLWIDPATGRQVARKATRTRTNDEMRALGYVLSGRHCKHKFRLVIR